MNKVLHIDDVELCEILAEYISLEGFGIDVMHDGKSGAEQPLIKTIYGFDYQFTGS